MVREEERSEGAASRLDMARRSQAQVKWGETFIFRFLEGSLWSVTLKISFQDVDCGA